MRKKTTILHTHQQQHHQHNNNSKKKSDVLLSVPNTPSKSGWLFGQKNGEEKPLKTPPSSPPLKQKVLEKGKGSNSSSTGFLGQLFSKLTSSSSCTTKAIPRRLRKLTINLLEAILGKLNAPLCKKSANARENAANRPSSSVQYRGGSLRSFQSVGKDLSGGIETKRITSRHRRREQKVGQRTVGDWGYVPVGCYWRVSDRSNSRAQEAMLLNSREKAPYLICFEVIRPTAENNTSGGENSYSESLRAEDRGDSISSNNSFSSRSNSRRNPF